MAAFLTHFGYAAILATLLAAGLGMPFPEELVQLTAGALAHDGVLRLAPAIAVCWFGIVAGDLAFFLVARRAGPRILSSRHIARLLTPRRRDWLERHFARHAFWTIAAARHASGLRLPAFALAAVHGVKVRTFVLADGLSACVSVPVVVTVGYLAFAHLDTVRHDLRRVEILAAAVLAAILLAVHLARRRRAAG
jgi:membrane protein DedA with SNARE-associated domain